jgi:hypothetical protein
VFLSLGPISTSILLVVRYPEELAGNVTQHHAFDALQIDGTCDTPMASTRRTALREMPRARAMARTPCPSLLSRNTAVFGVIHITDFCFRTRYFISCLGCWLRLFLGLCQRRRDGFMHQRLYHLPVETSCAHENKRTDTRNGVSGTLELKTALSLHVLLIENTNIGHNEQCFTKHWEFAVHAQE